MAPGTKVQISLPEYPGQVFPGVIVRKAGAGFRVRYESWGAFFTASVPLARILPQ